MYPLYRSSFRSSGFVSSVLVLIALSVSVLGWQNGVATRDALSAAEQKAVTKVKVETIREITTALSSKEFEGRGTGQPGADKAAAYLADRFAKLGLKPAGENNTFLQPIKFRSTEISPESSVKIGDADLKHGADYVILPPYTSEQADVTGGVVFAGFGVVSTELKRDDLAGLDLKGKVVVILGGQPAGVNEEVWARATSPQNRAMTLFGRGAIAMIVANAGTPQQPYSTISNYLSRRRVTLASQPASAFRLPPVLLASDAGMAKMFSGIGADYQETLTKAMTGEAVSRDLGKTANIALRFKLADTTSSNVVAVLEGSDPKLKDEAVVYTAHYDAYGIDASGQIFPGAADNALGTATITAIAEAFVKSAARPRRSIIFLAVTGEEYGLFGAEHWVRNPTWPLNKVAANINYDGIGTETYGPVKRVIAFGAEHSDLGSVFEDVAAATGLTITPDPMPEENVFVRSDHYAFVKRGVPAVMLMGGPDGDMAVWIQRARKWLDTDYHSVNDVVKPDWNWGGPQKLAQVGLVMGMRVADAEAMPAWKPTSRFNKPRPA